MAPKKGGGGGWVGAGLAPTPGPSPGAAGEGRRRGSPVVGAVRCSAAQAAAFGVGERGSRHSTRISIRLTDHFGCFRFTTWSPRAGTTAPRQARADRWRRALRTCFRGRKHGTQVGRTAFGLRPHRRRRRSSRPERGTRRADGFQGIDSKRNSHWPVRSWVRRGARRSSMRRSRPVDSST